MVLTISRPSVTIRSVSKPVTITTRRGGTSYRPSSVSSSSNRNTNRRYQNQREIERRIADSRRKKKSVPIPKKSQLITKTVAKPLPKISKIAYQAGKAAGAPYSNIGKKGLKMAPRPPTQVVLQGKVKVKSTQSRGKPHGRRTVYRPIRRVGKSIKPKITKLPDLGRGTDTSGWKKIDDGPRGNPNYVPTGNEKRQYLVSSSKTARVALGKKLAQANIIQRKNQANVGKALVKAGKIGRKKKELGKIGRKKKGKGKKIGKGTKLYNV